jgi:hypothetical protein
MLAADAAQVSFPDNPDPAEICAESLNDAIGNAFELIVKRDSRKNQTEDTVYPFLPESIHDYDPPLTASFMKK